MEKLSIREASERFGLSRARLYKLLGDGIITGELSKKRGKGGCSWVDTNSLKVHINARDIKLRHGKGGGKKGCSGRTKITGDGIYIPVVEAAKKSGYSSRHIKKGGRGFDELLINTVVLSDGEMSIRVIDLETLIKIKNSTKRPRDKLVASLLIALRENIKKQNSG